MKESSTQEYLDIEEIHNGVIILKNASMRVVLMVSTVNFALKSEDEQNAIIYAYQNFLNSLPFPIQMVMQSRRIDLSGYLSKLREREKTATGELIRLQTTDYIAFIERLVSVANIMSKKFFVTSIGIPQLLLISLQFLKILLLPLQRSAPKPLSLIQ